MSALTQILKAFSINGLSSGTTPLGGTEEIPIWQSSATVKVTVQDIADLASGSNIGNADLTISASGTRKLILGGALSTDEFTIRDSADTLDFFKVNGVGAVWSDGGTGNSTNTFYGDNAPTSYAGSTHQNSSFGDEAMDALTTGYQNTAVGYKALTTATTGLGNTAVGQASLRDNNGTYSTAIGWQSGFLSTGSSNTFVGSSAGRSKTGGNSVAIGSNALYSSTSGAATTAVGVSAGQDITTGGVDSVFLGKDSGRGITTGSYNTIIGKKTGLSTTLANNVIVADGQGNEALWKDASNYVGFGYDSTADTLGATVSVKGHGALSSDKLFRIQDSTATNDFFLVNGVGDVWANGKGSVATNTSFGEGNLNASTSGANNVAVGYNNLTALTTGARNVAIGVNALDAQTTQSNSVAIGYNALSTAHSGDNVGVGYEAGKSNTVYRNVYIGSYAGRDHTGQGAEFIGWQAGILSTNISNCTFIGAQAGYSATSGANVGIGTSSLRTITSLYNVGVGVDTMKVATSARDNTAIGHSAGYDMTTGDYNTLLGAWSGQNITTGQDNTIIGASTATSIITGTDNTIIGRGADLGSDVSNHVFITDGAGNEAITKDNNGNVWLGDASALATTATNGFNYVRGGAGTPTGTPATSVTGHVPMYADTTNNKLYIYSGGSWVALN